MLAMNEPCVGDAHSADLGALARPFSALFPLTRPYSQLTLFAGVDKDVLDRLERLSINSYFQADQIIYSHDDPTSHLHIVVSEFVKISYLLADGSIVLHDVLPPGGTFGGLSLHAQMNFSDIATTIGPTIVMSIPLSVLSDHCRRCPSLEAAIGRAIVARYRDYLRAVHDLSLQNLQARLARSLIRLADRLNMKTRHLGREVQIIESMVTQSDLGLMARGSRGNVNRTLQLWQRSGWILLRDRTILILNRRALIDTVLEA